MKPADAPLSNRAELFRQTEPPLALLAEVAVRLQDAIREHDTLARLGGDEFAILVSDAGDARRIEQICRNIIGSVAEPVSFHGSQIRSGASIGIATYTPRAMTSSQLYKASDLALYAAKKQGRGSWVWFGEALPGTGTTSKSQDMLQIKRSKL